jgi:SAM-dependent methyltransferase
MSKPRYTHGHHESVLRSHRARTAENSAAYLLPRLRPGLALLDVGCGPGTITVDLARLVAPGRVVGIDAAPAIVEAATSEAQQQGVDGVEFSVGDVYALEFDDNSFDVVHAHQVLQHVPDPAGALRVMRRVCRPGGVVAARDSDYRAMTWHPADPMLDRWLEVYEAVARGNGGEPDAGRWMLSWAQAAGFSEIDAGASVWCWSTPAERAWWGGLWADRVTTSALADQAVEAGVADRAELDALAAAFRHWAAAPDGWWAVLHGEVLCTP